MPRTSTFPVLTEWPAGGKLTTSASALCPLSLFAESAYVAESVFGVAGGTFTSGAWQKRLLNDGSGPAGWFQFNAGTNDFTLLASATYRFMGYAQAYGVGAHLARLALTPGGSSYASPAYSNITEPSMTSSMFDASFTVTTDTVVSVEHYCDTTKATNGLGVHPLYATLLVPANFVYLRILRLPT